MQIKKTLVWKSKASVGDKVINTDNHRHGIVITTKTTAYCPPAAFIHLIEYEDETRKWVNDKYVSSLDGNLNPTVREFTMFFTSKFDVGDKVYRSNSRYSSIHGTVVKVYSEADASSDMITFKYLIETADLEREVIKELVLHKEE